MSNYEDRLDRYIDALNSGQATNSRDGDPELAGLFETVRQLHALRESNIPVALASSLSKQLQATAEPAPLNSHPERSAAQSNGSLDYPNSWARPTYSSQDGIVEPPPKHWLRQVAQFAGAALAFTLFGLVLVLVFQGVGDGNGSGEEAFGAGTQPMAQLAFSANSEHPDPDLVGAPEIYLVNADGSGITTLASGAFPSWSPDGYSIAYTGFGGSTGAIHIMNADGSDQRRLTDSDVDELMPTWAPDGERIAFLRASPEEDREAFSLWVVNADGSGERMLAEENAGLFYQVTWSPDSSQIAFTRKIEGNLHHVEIVDITNGDMRTLLESPNGPHVRLTWSPDGSRIASMSVNNEYAAPPQINLIDVQTGEIDLLPATPGAQMSPAWSPGGELIAFAGEFDDMEGIYTFRLDDVDAQPRLVSVQADTGYSWPSWSPDATQIAVILNPRVTTDSGEIRSTVQVAVVDLDGPNLTVVADNIPLVALGPPAWRPMPSSMPADEDATPTPIPGSTVEAVEPPSSISDPTVVPKEQTRSPELPGAPDSDPDVGSLPTISLTDDTDGIGGPPHSYGWIDEESESYVRIDAPFVDVGDDGLSVPPSGHLQVDIADNVASPETASASVYTWDDNNEIPEDTEGNVGTYPWFTPRAEPVSTSAIDLENPTFSMPEEPGRYIVQIEMEWPDDARLNPDQQPIFAHYAFTVYVE